MHTSIQCTGNKSRFLKIEHILNLIWPSDNLLYGFQDEGKNCEILNRQQMTIGYLSDSSDRKKC